MKSSFLKSIAVVALLAVLGGCGNSSSVTSSITSSLWVGITVDDVANPTTIYLANFATNSIKSVPIAGGASTSMTNASPVLSGPEGLALVGANLYVVDALNHAVRQVSTASPYTTTTYAGTVGTSGNSDLNGTFNLPRNVVADAAGNLYVTDSVNNTVRKIATGTKAVTTVASGFNNPWGITIDNDLPQNLYVTDIGTHSVKKVTLAGAVSTFAGNVAGNPGDPTNADGTAAFFRNPLGITTDGNYLYVVDSGNNAIRRIDLTAPYTVSLMAGSAAKTAGNMDSTTGTLALFSEPWGITYGGNFLYVTDQAATLIRKVSTAGLFPVSRITLN